MMGIQESSCFTLVLLFTSLLDQVSEVATQEKEDERYILLPLIWCYKIFCYFNFLCKNIFVVYDTYKNF